MVLGNYSVGRIEDQTYYLKTENGLSSKFQIKDSKISAETARFVAEKAIKLYLEEVSQDSNYTFNTIRFRYGGMKWKVIQPHESKWYSFILKFFQIIFFHKPANNCPNEFKIERAWYAEARDEDLILRSEQKEWKSIISKQVDRANYQSLRNSIKDLTPQEYAQGIRGKVLESNEDPFTELATLAFRHFEPHIKSKDGATPLDSQYRIIRQNEMFLLVDAKCELATETALNETAEFYKAHLVEMWGKDKIDYIDHLYKLNLKEVLSLSPEHIFRINCGTINLEIQDIESGIAQIQTLATAAGDIALGTSFASFAAPFIPKFLLNKIQNQLMIESQGLEPTLHHFFSWMEKHAFFTVPVSQLSPDKFMSLLDIFGLTKQEVEFRYTGKKILNVIQGAYESGEYKIYKAFQDDLEFNQTLPKLVKGSFESYLEKLSLIIVKKHLAKRHPVDILRVGSLIPAPPLTPGDQPRWYKVSACVTNQYIYSYTLESACNDPTLPVIKVCRNTASSPYAVYSSKSILNDLNLLNPPGYMGVNLLDPHEEAFYKEFTIPLWVGCHQLAKQKMQVEGPSENVVDLLIRANEAYQRSLNRGYQTLSFRDILKKHDLILNELYFRNDYIYDYEGKNLSPKYLSHLKKLVKKYILVSEKKFNAIDSEMIKKDALAFKKVLERVLEGETENREKCLIEELLNDLHLHILDENAHAEWKNQLENHKLNGLNEFKSAVLSSSHEEEKLTTLKLWSEQLEALADEMGESLESKSSRSLVFTGHSLGGAVAQIMLTRYLTNQERMPLPGQNCMLAEFDAPGINADDNARFLSFGNQNEDVLLGLENKFITFRRQERGDIVPGVGEEHLGAGFKADPQKISWHIFDAALNRRLKTATRKEIALVSSVHDTRFLDGCALEGEIVLENNEVRCEKGEFIPNADYETLKYNADIQLIFDTHGKKGSSEKSKEIYNELYYKFWKFPRYQVLNESFRKSTDYMACRIRRMLLADRVKERRFSKKMQDAYGSVFVH